MCGVSACENSQNRVSHGESVRVGSSALIYFCTLYKLYSLPLIFCPNNVKSTIASKVTKVLLLVTGQLD